MAPLGMALARLSNPCALNKPGLRYTLYVRLDTGMIGAKRSSRWLRSEHCWHGQGVHCRDAAQEPEAAQEAGSRHGGRGPRPRVAIVRQRAALCHP